MYKPDINKNFILHELNRVNISRTKILVLFIFVLIVALLVWTTPRSANKGTIKVYDRNDKLIYESSNNLGKNEHIELTDVPQKLIETIILTEDKRFYEHSGVDSQAIFRALVQSVKSKRIVSGGSTITQQYLRSTDQSLQKYVGRNPIRKTREILMALRYELFHSKQDILESYVNSVYLGNRAYGFESASQTYFSKSASALSIGEIAGLVALIPSPNGADPLKNPDEFETRRKRILQKIKDQGLINEEEYNDAIIGTLNFTQRTTQAATMNFVDHILTEYEDMGVKSNGGVKIKTTLDSDLNAEATRIASQVIEDLSKKHKVSNAAVVIIDNKTRELLTMVGGIDYDRAPDGNFNMALAMRQPGSAMKPVTYLSAFEKGFTPATLIFDVPTQYRTKNGDGFTPNNYDGKYHGMVLVREALASSYNLPAVEMLNRIGIESFLKTAQDMGITTLNRKGDYDLALTLGGGEVNLAELTNLYATIARGGKYKKYVEITQITDDKGKILWEQETIKGALNEENQVLGENGDQVSYLIADILSDPTARIPGFGEKSPLNLSVPAAVKTGTTTDWHDNWTIGFVPEYTVGVWVGNNNNDPMANLTGVTGAAPIWNRIFEYLIAHNNITWYGKPINITTREICTETGLLYDGICEKKYTEKFVSGTEPTEISQVHEVVAIDIRNGLLASESCPQQFSQQKTFITYPPEVYTWALENSLDIMPEEFSPLCPSDGKTATLGEGYVKIISPKNNAEFMVASDLNTASEMVFEANVSESVAELEWYLNGGLISKTKTNKAYWNPIPGEYQLKVVGKTLDGTSDTDQVQFVVLEEKEE